MKLLDKFRPVRQMFEEHKGAQFWEHPEEPHADRRKEILEKHPEIMKLPRYDPFTSLLVTLFVFIQFVMLTQVHKFSWPVLIVLTFFVSATCNHSLGAAIHEIGHNLAFGNHRPFLNRLLGYWSNLPLFVPFSVSYKRYHHDHHKYMGDEEKDVDIPTAFEVKYFRSSVGKFGWLLLHPVIHAIRPYVKVPKAFSMLELLNIVIQVAFDLAVLKVFGIKGCAYLLIGTFWGFGIHPFAAHFFAEHYMFFDGMATMSYYGPMNYFLFNVGYHNEHHDFPFVPFSQLPTIRALAPEYYETLPYHKSWVKVLWDFIFDSNIGPHAHGVGYLKEDLKEEWSKMKKEQKSVVNCDSVSTDDDEHSLAYKQE